MSCLQLFVQNQDVIHQTLPQLNHCYSFIQRNRRFLAYLDLGCCYRFGGLGDPGIRVLELVERIVSWSEERPRLRSPRGPRRGVGVKDRSHCEIYVGGYRSIELVEPVKGPRSRR
jgi:hypothetical protein